MRLHGRMSKLKTDFIKIGQSGPTVDGRIIEPQWLLDAAENYDPATYTAMIWPDHFRFMNYGKVLELKAEHTEKGVVSLYARLEPNASYLRDNQYSQRLFFSMELDGNFADSGKAYLVGLGITDSPASLGTDELKFSARRHSPHSRFYAGTEFTGLEPEETMPGWFRRFADKLFNQQPEKDPAQAPQHQEDPMEKEQFDALSGKLDSLTETLGKLTEQFSNAARPEAASGTAPAEQPAETAQPAAQADADSYTALATSIEKLSQQVSDIATRLSSARPATAVPDSHGPAGDNTALY